MTAEIDYEYTKGIVCPFCGHKFHDSWEYLESMRGSGILLECTGEECGKSFYCEPDYDITFVSSKPKEASDGR